MARGLASPFSSPMSRRIEECHKSKQLFQSATWASNTLWGCLQPGSLELSQCSEGWSEIIVQGEMRWIDRMGLQKDCGGLACFLDQPCHVVRKTLRVPDFEAEGPCRLKLFLAHSEASSTWLSLPIAGRDPESIIPRSPAVRY